MTILLKRALCRQTLIALLLVVGLTLGVVGLGQTGVGFPGAETVSAHSICDQHRSHTHGYSWWQRTDEYDEHGNGMSPQGYYSHWVRHENSSKDWCSD